MNSNQNLWKTSQQLGIKKTFISPCHPEANGKLESSHRIIKDSVRKFSAVGGLQWDQLLQYETAAFNCFQNEHSQESPHFLYYGHDPYLPHIAALFQPKLQYVGSDEGMICLDKVRQAYILAALNMREA